MRTRAGLLLGVVLFGGVFGYSLARIGFGDFGQLNAMFGLRDPRMLLSFAGGVMLATALTALLRLTPDRALFDPRTGTRLHAGVVPGALLFGTGWALCGGCPSIPLVQLSAGYLPAAITLVGIAVGMRLYRWANPRYLHIDSGSCGM